MEYLEEETYAHGTQNSVPYHLDQIDQGCSEPLDNSFQPTGDGEGTDIYILDSGELEKMNAWIIPCNLIAKIVLNGVARL